MFDASITSDRTKDNLKDLEFMREVSDPIDVVMVRGVVPNALVAEYGSGSIVKMDNTGEEIFRISGINLPRKIVINQDF